MSSATEPEVLIVGAGPVGLTLAGLLAGRGVSVAVVERRRELSSMPRAVSIDDLSARILVRAGLGRCIDELVTPASGTAYHGMDGRRLVLASGSRGMPNGFAGKNMISQPDIERALLSRLADATCCEVMLGTTWIGTRQEGDGRVTSIAQQPDGRIREIASRFLVGCDGADSRVRASLGTRFTGREFRQPWLAVDLVNDPLTSTCAHHYGDPRQPRVVVPRGNGECRYEFRLANKEPGEDRVVPFGLLERMMAPYRSISRDDVVRASVYTFGARIVERWRAGPTLLAGDAAHVMPPFAGAGLNCGILDADNLAWRLFSVIRAGADEALLDRYGLERRRHVLVTIRLSVLLGWLMMTTSSAAARLRDQLCRSLLQLSPGARTYLKESRFRPRPRIRGDVTFMGTSILPNVMVEVDGDSAPIDDALRGGFAVLHAVSTPAPATARPQMPRAVGRLACAPQATAVHPCGREVTASLRRWMGDDVLLVRPDAAICGRFRAGDVASIRSRLRSEFGLTDPHVTVLTLAWSA